MYNIYIVDYLNVGRANGLTTYVQELARGIKKTKDIRLHYIWINSTDKKDFERDVVEDITNYYIPRHIAVLDDPSNYDVKVADYLATDMKEQKNVIVHFNWINHCLFAHILKKKVNCKTILTKHCIPWRDFIVGRYPLFRQLDETFREKGNKRKLHDALKREWISYDAVDYIICVTHYAKRVLTDLFQYPENKISVIHNGLGGKSLVRQQRTKYSLREKYGFDTTEKIILFAGNIDRRKGAIDLVTAFEKLVEHYDKKVRLVLAGSGQHNEIFSKITQHWAKITLTGNICKEILYDFYAMADIGIVPSYVEQCSYTAIEMMYAGLPIIVSDVDGLKELLPDDCGLKVKLMLGKEKAYIDHKDLNKKLLFYLENESIARKYALRAQKQAENKFNARQMVNKTLDIYEKVINHENKQKPIAFSYLKNKPLVSVLLPCYNTDRYIADCMESILKQSYSHFELIVIDDASKDNTSKIIKGFNDHRIRDVKNSKNLGIEKSMNKAIAMAKGQYAARIDADDLMHPDRLERQVMYLEQNSSVPVVGSWHYVIDRIGRPIHLQEYPADDKSIRLLMLFRNPCSNPSVMMQTKVLNKLKYSSKYKYCEDYEFWFKITDQNKMVNIQEYLTYYRIHDHNISAIHNKEQKQNTLTLLSDEFSRSGLKHSAAEMVIHGAICFGYGKRFFNSNKKRNGLNLWLDKLLSHFAKKNHFSPEFKKEIKNYIISHYCGLEPVEMKYSEPVSSKSKAYVEKFSLRPTT